MDYYKDRQVKAQQVGQSEASLNMAARIERAQMDGAVQRKSQFHDVMQDLEGSISRVDNLVAQLLAKIEPACRPSMPEPTRPGHPDGHPPSAALVLAVSVQAGRIDVIAERIIDAMNRLEI